MDRCGRDRPRRLIQGERIKTNTVYQKRFERNLYIDINILLYVRKPRKSIREFGIENIKFDTSLVADQPSKEYLAEVSQVFTDSLNKLCVPNCVSYSTPLIVSINTTTPFDYIKLTTDESYNLRTTTEGILYV